MQARRESRILLPREHGAWGIVSIPFVTAATISGTLNLPVALAGVAVLLAFAARYPWELLLVPSSYVRAGRLPRPFLFRWALLYTLALAAMGVSLVLGWRLHALLPLAGLGALLFALRVWLGRRGAERHLPVELLGTAGLTLSSLVARVAATGSVDRTGLLVWVLNCGFFFSGIVYVKSRLQARMAVHRPEAALPAAQLLGFHLALVTGVAGAALGGWLPALVVFPFGLAAARAAWGMRRASCPFALHNLGWSEVGLSLVFATFLTLGFRL